MFRKLTLSLLLTVTVILVSKLSFANLITVNGGSTPYTLDNNDTLFIASGTYTGSVSGLSSNNRTIIVAGGANFEPTALAPSNGVVCKMHIYGTFTYSSSLTTNTNFTLDVYAGGVVNLAAMNTKGRDQVWTNHYGGTMNFSGDVLVNGGTQADDNNIFINYETINFNANLQMNSGSQITNYKNITVAGSFVVNGGTLRNEGKLDVTGLLDFNNGAAIIHNYCGLSASGGIENSSNNFYNYSYLHAINSDITNTANIINVVSNHSTPMIHGRNFTQTGGTMTGPGLLYFEGTTLISGGTIGVLGVTTDTIKMNDITRTNPSQIFDNQAANTLRPNVIYNAWGVPDPTRVWWWGCSIEVLLEVPLAIDWNYFFVNLSDNIPVLTWSAEYGPGTVFEVQRSYDGTNFSFIKDLPSEVGKSEYGFSDRSVNSSKPVVYYRIKGIELSGAEKYTQTRIVRFRNKQGVSIYTAPNPFINSFIINYLGSEKEMITIRMFNVSGQQKLVKTVSVNNGTNTINITEAAHLASGLYVIQVSRDNNIILSGKIIKQ